MVADVHTIGFTPRHGTCSAEMGAKITIPIRFIRGTNQDYDGNEEQC